MSVPSILLVPTHKMSLPGALAAAIAEIYVRRGRRIRLHQVGVSGPAAAWDRWEGSSFLDPGLYQMTMLQELYARSTHGGEMSLLYASRGPFDTGESGPWKVLDVAKALDCPCVLLLDSSGWGESLAALVRGFMDSFAGFGDVNLAGVIVSGLEDEHQAKRVRRVCEQLRLRVFGYLFRGEGLEPQAPAPGPWSLPLDESLLSTVERRVDLSALEEAASQRGFLPSKGCLYDDSVDGGPLVLVAGGRGFSPWSRDSIELLRVKGATVRRLDLIEDDELPPEACGLVLAGGLWPQAMSEIASNYSLMRSVRMAIEGGLPTLALGGGMVYLLRNVQDALGRRHELAGLLPADAEVISELEEPVFYAVGAERDNLVMRAGERLPGWMVSDVDLMNEPVTVRFPLKISLPGTGEAMFEGAASPNLLCTRLLFHFASRPSTAERFVGACRMFAGAE